MNNETNNNVNNTENAGGISFVHVGAQNGNVGTSPMPGQGGQPVPQTSVNQGMPMANTPQVEPQPVTPTPVSFVSVGASNSASNQTQQGTIPTQATIPTMVQPVQNSMPQAAPAPVMPNQPISQPLNGGLPPQMPGVPGQPNATVSEEKSNKAPVVLIIITILVVAGVTVFLIMYLTGKISFGPKPNNNQGNGTTQTEQQGQAVKLANWMDYLLEQEIVDIKLTRYVDADNTTLVSLNSDQLKEIFTKMKKYSLVKYYSDTEAVANDQLEVTYTLDGMAYSFKILGENFKFDEDSKIVELFNKSEYNVEDDGHTSRDGEDYNYILKDFDTKIYDDYFTSQVSNGE